MDVEDFRTILGNSGVDIWGFIDAAIRVASVDYWDELRVRRDGIVEKLYTNCPSCNPEQPRISNGFASNVVEDVFGIEKEMPNKANSPSTPVSIGGDDDEQQEQEKRYDDDDVDDDENEDEDDELRRILSIKEQIEDPHQSESSLVGLLQSLADMDITFKALKETDIGRHVNRLRKHPSSDVRRLVKLLVRKWKDLVDEWVRLNTPGEVQSSNNLIADGDSPQQNAFRNHQNGHQNQNQVPDFAYSPNPHNGSSGSDKNNSEPEAKRKAPAPPPRRDPPAKPVKSASPASAPPPNRQKEVQIDPDRLASARKRLQENYQEAQNAKKQRTIQVMDIHEIPKPRNAFFGRNKGGFQRH